MDKVDIVHNYQYLSRESVGCLKGLFSILVLIHHLYQFSGLISIKQRILGFILQSCGYLSVGMFFFFTGYGMMSSRNNKSYVKKIGKKRILPLYVINVILIFFYSVWFRIIGNSFAINDFLQSFLFGKTIVPLGWYLQASFVVYLMFWITFTITKTDNDCITITSFLLVFYCVVCMSVHLQTTWYESILCVLLGMIWCVKKNIIEYKLNTNYWFYLSFSFVFFLFSILLSVKAPIFSIVFKMCSSILFASFIMIVCFSLPNNLLVNPLTKFLGKYSLEIYACQGIFLKLRRGGEVYIHDSYLFILIVIIGTLVISVLIKPIFDKIIETIKNDD